MRDQYPARAAVCLLQDDNAGHLFPRSKSASGAHVAIEVCNFATPGNACVVRHNENQGVPGCLPITCPSVKAVTTILCNAWPIAREDSWDHSQGEDTPSKHQSLAAYCTVPATATITLANVMMLARMKIRSEFSPYFFTILSMFILPRYAPTKHTQKNTAGYDHGTKPPVTYPTATALLVSAIWVEALGLQSCGGGSYYGRHNCGRTVTLTLNPKLQPCPAPNTNCSLPYSMQ